LRVKAIHRLSGLKRGAPATPSIWKASPAGASTRRNQTEALSSRLEGSGPPGSGRRELKASKRPSGLKRGAFELKAALVRRTAPAEASAGASQISLSRRFSLSMIRVRTKATRVPSGEMAGLVALSIR
jgi:hypothetical protein